MDIGKNIKDGMAIKGLTQAKLASIVGVKQNTVSQWVTGVNEPSCEMIVRICKALDITPSELFDWE